MCHVPPCRAKQHGLADPAAARPDGGMRVACPGCGTEYEAPDQAVGRALRCAACGHVFRAGGGVPPPAPPPSDSPAGSAPAAPHHPAEPSPVEDLAPAAPDRAESLAAAPASVAGVSTAPRIAWGASIALLVAAGIALHAFREQIVEAWPPMLRLYRALGLL
jgi:predicted Zn finger-like uncharacterized protein